MLVINHELKELIPPLQKEEYQLLEKSILEEGCRDSIIVWDNTIIDGHNRYEICTRNNIPFKTQEMDFDNIEDVKEWMINNQFSRRNLPLYQRAVLALKLKPIIKKKAKENQGIRVDIPENSPKGYTPIETREEISKQAGVSSNTISKVETIEKKAPEEVKRQLSSGEISINKAYTNIKNQEKKEALKVRAEEVAKEFKKDDLVEIIHDDCTNYLKTLEDNSIDLILLDPPYFGIVKDDWDNQWNNDEDFLNWCKEWMIECLRVLKPTGSFYLWGQVGEKSDILIHQKLLLDRLGFHFKDWITWKKRRGLGNRKGWLYTREECLWYVKDNNQFYWNEDEQYSNEKSDFTKGFSGYELKSEYKRITNVWDDIPEFIGNKGILHYTPKPIEAIERIIQTATKEGDIVLDVFAGSGTTGIASRNLNRKAILVENDINSINEIKRRLIDEL